MEGIRVSLIDQLIRRGGDAVFVDIKLFDAGNEALPDTVRHPFHGVLAGRPAVEVTHNGNGLGVRCPDTEHCAGLAVFLAQMRTEVAIGLLIVALLEQINGRSELFGVSLRCFNVISPFERCCSGYSTPTLYNLCLYITCFLREMQGLLCNILLKFSYVTHSFCTSST